MTTTKCIALENKTEFVIKNLIEASGNGSFRFFAPLRGQIKGNKFRLMHGSRFINHPFPVVVLGEVVEKEAGCEVRYSFANPWLSIFVLATVFIVLIGIFTVIASVGSIVLITFAGYFMVKSDRKSLVNKIKRYSSERLA